MPENTGGNDRRKFLQKTLLTMTAVGVGVAHSKKAEAQTMENPDFYAEGSVLERMRKELNEALRKPVNERKWVMVFDLQKCIGCKACTVACNSENNLPPGVLYRPVIEEEVGTFPNVKRTFIPRPCMHCDNPPCVSVCPVEATKKRPDGIVDIDYSACIGCRNCIAACPYGARTFDFGDFHGRGTPEIMPYEKRPAFEYGKEWPRSRETDISPMGNARKCHFCLHRIDAGMLPSCVTTCLGAGVFFGDINDKTSLVSELLGSKRNSMRLKEELGTNPSVFYLM